MTTLILALFAVAIYFAPTLTDALQWTRGEDGVTSLWTAHLTHWSAGHLFWDAMMLVVFGLIARRCFGLRVGRTFLFAAPLITLGVAHWSPELMSYRGLSGFDTLLFVFVCVKILCQAKFERGPRVASALLLFGLAGKTVFEAMTGAALFAQDMGPGVVAAPVAHLIGGALGVAIAIWPMPLAKEKAPAEAGAL